MDQDMYLEQQLYKSQGSDFMAPKLNIAPWIKHIVWASVIVVPILIVSLAPGRHWVVAFMAYMNCLLYSVFAIYFIKKGTLGCLIPVIVPIWLVVGSCIGIIYFAIFWPDEGYETMSGSVSFFAGGAKYQLAIFSFLLTYLGSLAWLLRKEGSVEQQSWMVSKSIAYISLFLVVAAVSIEIIFAFLPLPLFFHLWAGRLFTRYQTVLFVTGVVIVILPKVTKIWTVFFLAAMTFFYILRNARAMALVPLIAFFSGVFFFSQLKTRTKLTLALMMITSIPFFLMIGNTVRIILGAGALQASAQQRFSALKDWREAARQWDVGLGFFGRMYFTAGNLIVAHTPTLYPYRYPSPKKYAKEFAIYMLPDQAIRRVKGISDRTTKLSVLMHTDYTGTWLLRDYGMEVIETSSVETSTIGHFWMLGGYLPVLLGGFMVALVHAFTAGIIRRAWIRNPDKAVFYFGVLFYCFIWTLNWDFIQLWRNIFWNLIYAFVGFKLISPFLKIGRVETGIEEDYLELPQEAG